MKSSSLKIFWAQAVFFLGAIDANSIAEMTFDRAVCPGSFLPCTCDMTSTGLQLVCASQKSISDITKLFTNKFPADIDSLSITLQTPDNVTGIPDNVFSGKTVNSLTLSCPTNAMLQISPSAFSSLAAKLQSLTIDNCNLILTNFQFLQNFTKLTNLIITNATNPQAALLTLPSLPTLTSLTLGSSTHFGDLYAFPNLVSGLENLTIIQKTPMNPLPPFSTSLTINDDIITRIFLSIIPSSHKTLKNVVLANNGLRAVPSYLALLPKLMSLDLRGNPLPVFLSLPFGSFPIASPQFQFLSLAGANILKIEKGAFEALNASAWSWAIVDLSNNQLTRFESDAFFPILFQMAATAKPPVFSGVPKVGTYGGYIDVTRNKFDCKNPCWMTWIVLKNPNLLKHVNGAVCADGTPWTKVDASTLKQCPA